MRLLLFVILFTLQNISPALGHETGASTANISLEERLGATIPDGITFRGEEGNPVDLRSLMDKPLIVAPVYFHCMHECPLLLNGLAEALGRIDLVKPGRDFRVVALSFDERETPALAREKKPNYLAAIGKPFPSDAWRFLTGDNQNVRKFTDAVGFRFQRDGEDFSHPMTVVVLAPGGKIVRYLYGTSFLPLDVTMAVTEAGQGKVVRTAGRVLNYCFSYDPLKHTYVFNVLKVVGTVMVLVAGSFFAWLMITTKRQRGEY
ncbi:MAG: SCO family protein [Nitrospiraceae bacterium]|nr:SCO family protein [Nitrospiraceae bacterium]